jgi:hypothetical protein
MASKQQQANLLAHHAFEILSMHWMFWIALCGILISISFAIGFHLTSFTVSVILDDGIGLPT